MRGESTDNADLEYWLGRWASWMRWNVGELPGAPTVAAGFDSTASNYAVAEDDGEAYWETYLVPAIIHAVDAAIDSLEADHKRAIWWKYGLTTRPATIPDNVAILYSEAFQQVRVYVLARTAIAA